MKISRTLISTGFTTEFKQDFFTTLNRSGTLDNESSPKTKTKSVTTPFFGSWFGGISQTFDVKSFKSLTDNYRQVWYIDTESGQIEKSSSVMNVINETTASEIRKMWDKVEANALYGKSGSPAIPSTYFHQAAELRKKLAKEEDDDLKARMKDLAILKNSYLGTAIDMTAISNVMNFKIEDFDLMTNTQGMTAVEAGKQQAQAITALKKAEKGMTVCADPFCSYCK